MARFVIYEEVSKETILEQAEECIARSEAFFKNNPDREDANVGLWYGRHRVIRRDHIREDTMKHAEEAMNNPAVTRSDED